METVGTVAPRLQADPVILHLVALSLTDLEPDFRSFLDTISPEAKSYSIKDFVIATTGILMVSGGVKWPIIMKIINSLSSRPVDKLRSDAVALINGSHLVVPGNDIPNETLIYEIGTMRRTLVLPRAVVTTIYSLEGIFETVEENLK